MDIDTKLLRSFLSVATERSFSKAAARLACSQATMSIRIRTLEVQLRASLFERSYHQVNLTRAGLELLPYAQDLVDRHDVLLDRLQQDRISGSVRLGIAEDYVLPMLPRFLHRLRETHPGIEISIISALSRVLCQQVEARSLDMAVVTLAKARSDATVLAKPALHWVGAPSFTRREDQIWPMAFYPAGCAFRQMAMSSLEANHVQFREAISSASGQVIQSAVMSGTAITVMAEGTIPEGLNSVPPQLGLPKLPQTCIQIIERDGGLTTAAGRIKSMFIEIF